MTVERQNVIFGCPCEKGDCANNGTCLIDTTTPLVNVCKCAEPWTGLRCYEIVEDPGGGKTQREYFSCLFCET